MLRRCLTKFGFLSKIQTADNRCLDWLAQTLPNRGKEIRFKAKHPR